MLYWMDSRCSQSIFALCATFFTAFPYLTFAVSPIPSSYLQPYFLIVGTIIFLINIKDIKALITLDYLIMLISLLMGALLIGISFLTMNDLSTLVKYFNLGYLAPFMFVLLTLVYKFLIRTIELDKIRRFFEFTIIIYLCVGLFQTFIDHSFLVSIVGGMKTGYVETIGAKRGVISLASEPTYYGFYMVALAGVVAILRSRVFDKIAIGQVFFLAVSTTASFIIFVSLFITSLFNFKIKNRLFSLGFIFFIAIFIFSYVYPNSFRLLFMTNKLFNGNLSYFIYQDESTSIRFFHLVLPFFYLANNYFLPSILFDVSWSQYLEGLGLRWFFATPLNSRIINGIGEPLVIYGIFAFPVIFKFFKELSFFIIRNCPWFKLLAIALIMMMFTSFSFATPVVAFMYALIESNNEKVQ